MMKLRDWIASILVAITVAALLSAPSFDRLDGLGIDSLFWLREQLFPTDPSDAASSPTIVIAIDEETYRQPPFKDTPYALWTPYLADLIHGLLEADVQIIGFDVIFPTSAQSLLPGYDRSFLVAQRVASQQNKIVLSRFQHSRKVTAPFPGYGFAVGGSENIRASNLLTDRDDIVRRVPIVLVGTDSSGRENVEGGFSFEIARRVRKEVVSYDDGQVKIGDWKVPSDQRYGALINFRGGDPIPTYSLADIFACVKAGNRNFMQRQFRNKVVLLGAVLDIEDRKLTSRRFIVGAEKPYLTPRCVLAPLPGMHDEGLFRRSMPGIYIQAQAINDLVRSDTPAVLGRFEGAVILTIVGLLAALSAWALAPIAALTSLLIATLVWSIVASITFRLGLVLPLFDPPLACALTYSLLIFYRFRLVDHDQRYLRLAFSYYLPASLIENMIASDALPSLGGEEREITVWFSDLADFTHFAENMAPRAVVAHLNEYFTTVVDVVETHGGFVDKFIGDGVVAIFGAPMMLERHAAAAIDAATSLLSRLENLNLNPNMITRVGIHTGKAVVGNIGSAQRFNYTAIGDTVNVAARLEGANKTLGTQVLVSETARALAGNRIDLFEVARIRVSGRAQAITVHTPVPASLTAQDRQQFFFARTLIRERKFRLAAESLANLASRYPAAAALRTRALALEMKPPSSDWDGTFDLAGK